jgi:hypothetical protein
MTGQLVADVPSGVTLTHPKKLKKKKTLEQTEEKIDMI